jgi:mono/diheme cytochrome c family protein
MPRLSALLLSLFATLPALAAEADHHHHGPTPRESRQALALNAEEAAHLRLEMRTFLSGVQQIVAGAAANDMPLVAKSAQALGMAAAHEVPASLRQKLPLAFKKLGNATHMGFDDLARDAASMADPGLALQQLGRVMTNCVSCHATYRIEPVPKKH